MNLTILFFLFLSTLKFSAFGIGLECLQCKSQTADTDSDADNCRKADKNYLHDCPHNPPGIEYACTVRITTKNRGKKNEIKDIIRECTPIKDLHNKSLDLKSCKNLGEFFGCACITNGCNSQFNKGHSMKCGIGNMYVGFITTVVAASLLEFVM